MGITKVDGQIWERNKHFKYHRCNCKYGKDRQHKQKDKIHNQKQENNQEDLVDKRRNCVFQMRKRLATQIIMIIFF